MTRRIQQQLEAAQDCLTFAIRASTSEEREEFLRQARQGLNLALSVLQELGLRLRALEMRRS